MIIACRLFGAKPFSKPILGHYQLDPKPGRNFSETLSHISSFFIRENASKNVVCEMATIMYRGRLVQYWFSYLTTLIVRLHSSIHPGDWRSEHNGHNFANGIFKCSFSDENHYILWFKIHWNLFLIFQLTITHHCFRCNGLAPNRRQVIHYPIHGRIYASLDQYELSNQNIDRRIVIIIFVIIIVIFLC